MSPSKILAYGLLTDKPIDTIYLNVVFLRGFQNLMLVSELNGLVAWSTNVPSAYLEAFRLEEVCIITRTKLRLPQRGYLFFVKALYGLRTSLECWHERLANVH